jgi:hypothetical protein
MGLAPSDYLELIPSNKNQPETTKVLGARRHRKDGGRLGSVHRDSDLGRRGLMSRMRLTHNPRLQRNIPQRCRQWSLWKT